MDSIKVGIFIKSLRESKGWTQNQLASMLNVTYKAVSKWENGGGLPDTSIFPQLAKLFGVSSDELLAGEKRDYSSIKTKYELALEIDDINTMTTFLVNDDLNIADEKGNIFLYYVVNKNRIDLVPFCLHRKLFEINESGVIIVPSNGDKYDKELSTMIISNYLIKSWVKNEPEMSNITRRKYTKDELNLIIEIAKSMNKSQHEELKTSYFYMFLVIDENGKIPNPYILEIIEVLFIELKLYLLTDTNQFLKNLSQVLISNNLKLSDKLVDFFYKNKILFIKKPQDAYPLLSEYGYNLYLKMHYDLGDIDDVLSLYNIYDEYKKGNRSFIEKIIDRKETSTELYSVSELIGKVRVNTGDPYDYEYNEQIIPGKETEYKLAEFFNEDYPDVVELLIRKRKGIPENRPIKTEKGELRPRKVGQSTGMSVKFIRTLFETLIDKVETLENEIRKLKNK